MRPKSTAERAEVSDLLLSVDRSSPVPLYYQLSQQLEQAIEQGRLRPGSLLGNEVAFAAELGLSRPTVRQAIKALVDKGLMVRRRGVGTLVVHSQVKRPLELSSLYDDLEAASTSAPPPGSWATGSSPPLPGSPPPSVSRKAPTSTSWSGCGPRTTNRWPCCATTCLLYLVDLGTERLEATGLYRIMRAAGITLHSARQSVGARLATAEEAARLAEPEGAPLLTMERTTYDDTGRAVEFASHVYRASRYAFDFQLLVR